MKFVLKQRRYGLSLFAVLLVVLFGFSGCGGGSKKKGDASGDNSDVSGDNSGNGGLFGNNGNSPGNTGLGGNTGNNSGGTGVDGTGNNSNGGNNTGTNGGNNGGSSGSNGTAGTAGKDGAAGAKGDAGPQGPIGPGVYTILNIEAVHDGKNDSVKVTFEGLSETADLKNTKMIFAKTLYQSEIKQSDDDDAALNTISYTIDEDGNRVLKLYRDLYKNNFANPSGADSDGFLKAGDYFVLFLSGFSDGAFNDEDIEIIESYLDSQVDLENAFAVTTVSAGSWTAVVYSANRLISVDGYGDNVDAGIWIDPLPEGLLTDNNGSGNIGGYLYLLDDSEPYIDAEPFACKVTVSEAGADENGTVKSGSTLVFSFFDEDEVAVFMDGHSLAASVETKMAVEPFSQADILTNHPLSRFDATSISVNLTSDVVIHADTQKTAGAGVTVTFASYTLSSQSGLGNRAPVTCLVSDIVEPTYTITATGNIDEDYRVEGGQTIRFTFSENMENGAGEVATAIQDLLKAQCAGFTVTPANTDASVFNAPVPADCNASEGYSTQTPIAPNFKGNAAISDLNGVRVAADATFQYDPPTPPLYEVSVIGVAADSLNEDYIAIATDKVRFGFSEPMENTDSLIRKAIAAALKNVLTGNGAAGVTEAAVSTSAVPCPTDGGLNYTVWDTDDADESPDVAFDAVQCWDFTLPADTTLTTSATGIRINLVGKDDNGIDLSTGHTENLIYDPPKPPTFTVTALQGNEDGENVWCDGELQGEAGGKDKIVFTFDEAMDDDTNNDYAELKAAIMAWFTGAQVTGSADVADTDIAMSQAGKVFTLTLPDGAYLDSRNERSVNLPGALKDKNNQGLNPATATMASYDVLQAALTVNTNYIANDDLFLEDDKLTIAFTNSGFNNICNMDDYFTLGAIQAAVDKLMGPEVAKVESIADANVEGADDNSYTVTILPNREFAPAANGSFLNIANATLEEFHRDIAGDKVTGSFQLKIEDPSSRRTLSFTALDPGNPDAAFYTADNPFSEGLWELTFTTGLGHDAVNWLEFADFDVIFEVLPEPAE